MFDMGFLELLLIGIIALIVLGPERLPKAARTVGLWIGKAKQGLDSIKTEIDRELKLKELQQQIAEQKAALSAELNVKSEFETLKDELTDSVNTIQDEATSAREVIAHKANRSTHNKSDMDTDINANTETKAADAELTREKASGDTRAAKNDINH